MLLLWAFFACDSTESYRFEQCELEVEPLTTEVSSGEALSLRGGPMSDAVDTAARLDGALVPVLAVERMECEACDTCLENEGCHACEPCLSCVAACEPCLERVDIKIPELETGEYSLILLNRYGASAPVTLTVRETVEEGR